MTGISKRRSRPTGALPDALRRWCEIEYKFAKFRAETSPFATVPKGANPKDWRLYVGTWAGPLIDEVMRSGIWEPDSLADRRVVRDEVAGE